MKKKISLRDLESLNNEEKQIKITIADVKNDPTTIMSKNELYETLDFRINSLRSEYSDVIHDIQEQGSNVFA
jgi:archaellum component FlaC